MPAILFYIVRKKMISIDGIKAIEAALESAFGLKEYEYIMKNHKNTDISKDLEFQRRYNYFYGVRRNAEWRENYYQIFESNKARTNTARTNTVTFENILCNIYVYTDKTEASFASKMLATLNPDMPIWDSKVLNILGLQLIGDSASEKQDCAIKLYDEIVAWYHEYLSTNEAKKNIELFDRFLPEYTWLTEVKKIDYMLWSLG